MAKKKEKKISDTPQVPEVTLKHPGMSLHIPRLGMRITEENLTFERYQKLIAISPSYEQYFNIKLKSQNNELETKE